jgi:peptidoglycan-associated lipoprotein
LSIALALLVAGCAGKPARDETPGPAAVPADVVSVTVPEATAAAAAGSEESMARDVLARQGMVVYFEYDSTQIRAQDVPLIAAHARHAGTFGGLILRLEGHADERGSREYNIGLGERRAQAVRRALLLQGVKETQLTTVSYGEERPAVPGSDESAYGKNRRVELVAGR